MSCHKAIVVIMVFTTEEFFEVAIESWPEWDLNLDFDIKIKDGKFHFGLFDKRDPFPFSIFRMPYKSSNVPSSIVYSAIGAVSLRIARASNNPESFSTAIKPLIAVRMSRLGLSIGEINSFILNFFKNIK